MASRYAPLKVYAEVMIPAERFGLTGEPFIFDMDALTTEQKRAVATTMNVNSANAVIALDKLPFRAAYPEGVPTLRDVFAVEIQEALDNGKVYKHKK